MDILYRAGWKDRTHATVDAPNASGVGRLALALCAIALTVGILETAANRSGSETVAWNVAGQERAQ